MKKKTISRLLAGALSVSMAAGGGMIGSAESAGYPTEIDMTEEPYQVAIQIVNMPGTEVGADYEARLESAINEITLPAINCTVDLQFEWISEVATNTSMGIAGNEKIDLVHVGTVQPISSMVGSDMLLDMNKDNLLQNRGPALVELFGDVLGAGAVDGQQLAIPANVFNASSKSFKYNKDMADEYNITIPQTGTMQDLEDALYAIHEANPDVMPFYVGGGTLNLLAWFADYETFGTESSYGVILDSSSDMKVENLYATDLFRDYVLRMYKWRQDGLIQRDMTDGTTGQEYYAAHNLFATTGNNNPYLAQQDGMNYDFNVGICDTTPAVINNSLVTEYMWGIAVNCERPDKAMDFLNFLYSNAQVANLVKYGLEGESYTFAEGSDSVIESNGTYNNAFYVGGDTSMMYVQAPADENYLTEMETFEESATVSPIIGYLFNDADYQTESSVIYSTILEYLPTLQNGMCGSEEATLAYLDEFNAALDAAGINDVIAANQEQLDTYLAQQ